MKTDRPVMDLTEHRVLKFRPRTSAQPPRDIASQNNYFGRGSATKDLSQFERTAGEPDDYRHRMLANAVAVAFTAILTAIGIWLAVKIGDLRSAQDCVLMGRRDCGHISTPQS